MTQTPSTARIEACQPQSCTLTSQRQFEFVSGVDRVNPDEPPENGGVSNYTIPDLKLVITTTEWNPKR